jgi:hypothetical protein
MPPQIPRSEAAFFDAKRIDASPVEVAQPPKQRRMLPFVQDNTTPTPHEMRVEELLCEVQDLLTQTQLYLLSQLKASVQTLDTVVFEHTTVELATGIATVTLNLPPQTAQQELITGLFAGITVPNLSAAPTITIQNAWAQLGSDLVNLNAILNSSGGTGGALPGEYAFVLNADDKRQINLVASGNWPVGSWLTFCLFGTTVPATLAEVLH